MNEIMETTTVETLPVVDKKTQKKHKKTEKDNRRFTKKKLPIGKIIFIFILVGIGVFAYFKLTNKGSSGLPVTTVTLAKGDLISSVNLTGTIESANDAEVYSKSSGILKSVNVKLGDRVEVGQLLAQLDTRDAKLDIAQKEATIEQTKRLGEFSVRSSEKDFDAQRVDVAAGLNAQLIAAENSVDRSQLALNAARRNYNDYKDDHEIADEVFKIAQKKLEKASDEYWKAKEALAAAGSSAPNDLKEAYKKAEEAFLTEKDNYNKVDREYGSEMSTEARTYRDARSDYEKALKDRDAAKNAVARNLDDLKDGVEKAELNMDFTADYLAIEQLKQKIADSTVTAPISGTITAVYAKDGGPSTGLLFLIEDTDNLLVKTAVKELDIGKVKTNMKAEVRADATGEKIFPAIVQTISPTATKDANGKTITSGNVEFETDVALTDSSELRVGMNVRINIVTEERKSVWSAPFDAVTSDANGKSIIYTIETDAQGISHAKSVPVTTGMETDFFVEIIGDQLKDDMRIINDPSTIKDNMEVFDTTIVEEIK